MARHGDSEGARRRRSALSFEQHETGERRSPGRAHVGARINVGLGPDAPPAASNDFNMFEEMDLAAKLAKVTALDPHSFLRRHHRARDGDHSRARVLGMEKEIGSIEPTKARRPDHGPPRPVPTPFRYTTSSRRWSTALKADDVRDVMVQRRPRCPRRQNPHAERTCDPSEGRRNTAPKITASLK